MKRRTTGIAELDLVLGGGLPQASCVVIAGGPGTCKTILAQHICFATAKAGGSAIYYTTLSEPHSKIVEHLEGFSFFDRALLGDRVKFQHLGALSDNDGAPSIDNVSNEVVRQAFVSRPDVIVIDSSKLETPPRALSVLTSIVLFVAVFEFLQLLGDFITYPKWVHALSPLALAVNVVLAIIERPDIRFDPERGIVPIPGVDNPIPYDVYVGYVLVYLAIAFGVLAAAFIAYGLRTHALARFRMMMTIGAGFFLFFVVIGLLPRLLYGDPTAETVKDALTVLQFVALGVGPPLLVGFAPPALIRSRFARMRHA